MVVLLILVPHVGSFSFVVLKIKKAVAKCHHKVQIFRYFCPV